jgi:hypothetical protein
MGIPNITTNLSGFGCFMEDLLETPEDYGCYIVDRRGQGVEESVNELVSLRSFLAFYLHTTDIPLPRFLHHLPPCFPTSGLAPTPSAVGLVPSCGLC